MQSYLYNKIYQLFPETAPATGIGIFRLLFGLVTLQEVLFLIYFNHLIFDPIPFLDVEFPMIVCFLWLWAAVALALMLGYCCQQAAITNYLLWLVFVNFTPMQRDFDGGFDLFMTGANFCLIFMPMDKALALDGLRKKLQTPFVHYAQYAVPKVSPLAYSLPVILCLGFLYFDSVIHKMFAPHWRNGLGAWLPSSMPYYMSALDLSWLLNQEYLQKLFGYTILVFQITFLALFYRRNLRPFYFLIGLGLHIGITLSFNIYPFGLGMLSFYALMMPFSWYKAIANVLQAKQASLRVFYDQQCPLCCRTVLTIKHFDIFNRVDFRPAQATAAQQPELQAIDSQQLLKDLYAVDAQGRVYAGVATYAKILRVMGYMAPVGWLITMPGVYQIACHIYRRIADNRQRQLCDSECMVPQAQYAPLLYDRLFINQDPKAVKRIARKLSKVLILLILLQLNSSLHYGLLYRLHVNTRQNPMFSVMTDISNAVLLFSNSLLGITPHALYLHDHFEGYDHILAITYLDDSGQEQWLPFINSQGRMLAPNWGRVHSMWANIAVTPNIDEVRLKKFLMKVTAFWGIKQNLSLDKTVFLLKVKTIKAPFEWEKDLRNNNLSGEWSNIGQISWQGKEVQIQMPKDIDTTH